VVIPVLLGSGILGNIRGCLFGVRVEWLRIPGIVGLGGRERKVEENGVKVNKGDSETGWNGGEENER